MQVRTPKILRPPVWPLPRSLATTCGISVDVFSSPYLDVSVQAVPHVWLFDSPYVTLRWVSPFGNLRISAHLQLPEAYRSLSQLICSSPKLIAAYHVLHRLLMPRHSPCALLCLTFVGGSLRLLGSNFKSWSNKIGSLTFELCRPYWRHLTVVQQNCKLP